VTAHRASEPQLAVPIAYAEDGTIVRPSAADPAGRYRCPGCGEPVVLRSGTARRAHFAHRSGEGCASESTLHRAAKRRIVSVVNSWVEDQGPAPCVARPCPVYGCNGGIVQDLPVDVTHAAEEVRLEDGSVADVVLFRGGSPAAVVEVRATHAVSDEKGRRLGIPWIELSAVEVLERPYWWVAVQDGFRPFACPKCTERARSEGEEVARIRTRALRVAERLDISLPSCPPYGCAPHTCWRCSGDIVVYAWPGGGMYSVEPPPEPRPGSVQHRTTDGAGNYWANTCTRCGATQGDHHLMGANEEYRAVLRSIEESDPGVR
jgi:predicted RNA-binding Zn-ribbon protein involved in translation (DUF1610 family)